jgi:hypothetical protein
MLKYAFHIGFAVFLWLAAATALGTLAGAFISFAISTIVWTANDVWPDPAFRNVCMVTFAWVGVLFGLLMLLNDMRGFLGAAGIRHPNTYTRLPHNYRDAA